MKLIDVNIAEICILSLSVSDLESHKGSKYRINNCAIRNPINTFINDSIADHFIFCIIHL